MDHSIEHLASELMDKQKARRIAEHSEVREPLSTTASSLAYECDRRLVYARCFPRDAAPYSDELLSIFSEGDLHAKDVKRELVDLGYEIVEQEVRFADKRLDISGAIDCKIVMPGTRDVAHSTKRIPVEIKSITGQAPRTEQEIRQSDNGLLRRYFGQLQTYLYLTNEEFGLFIFKDKITGLWTVVSVALDFSYTETLLKRAERVRDSVRFIEECKTNGDTREVIEGVLPARAIDRSICDGCPFSNTRCFPADKPVDPLLLAADEDLLDRLKARENTEATAKYFEKVDKVVKDRFKATPGTRFVVGDADGFLVEKKIQKNGVRINIRRLTATVEPTESAV